VTTYTDMACKMAHNVFTGAQTCLTLADKSLRSLGDAVLDAGACSPSGGVAEGAFAPDAPTTICCTQ
jgi:hypothetical protein